MTDTTDPQADPLTDRQLDEYAQLANAAYIGPWRNDQTQDDTAVVFAPATTEKGTEYAHVLFGADWGTGADAAFIAAARTAVPALVAEVRRLRRERDLAIAHDRQPYPTAWAYEQACKAVRRKTEAIERVRALHVPDENGECRNCGTSFDPCPTIAALDGPQPDAGPSRVTDETQQGPARPPSPRCEHCGHPKRDHDGRADHRAKSSPLVAGDPWCHACNAECDYAEQPGFQDRGDAARRAAGIDGTAGDAQDVPHAFVLDEPTGGCLVCGLSSTYRKHIDRPLDCGFCYEENGEEVHPHPECPIGSAGAADEAQQPETQAAADCPYGEGPGDGSGCIKPAGHDGDHVVTSGVAVVPCSRAVLQQPHIPHAWWPQPGMAYVHCPGPTATP